MGTDDLNIPDCVGHLEQLHHDLEILWRNEDGYRWACTCGKVYPYIIINECVAFDSYLEHCREVEGR